MKKIDQINERIKYLRGILKLSQEEFGQKIGIVRSGISNYEKGTREITNQAFISICREFNVNEAWLRDGVGEVFTEQSTEYIDLLASEYKLDQYTVDMLRNLMALEPTEREIFMQTCSKLFTPRKIMKTHADEVAEQLKALEQYEFVDLTGLPEDHPDVIEFRSLHNAPIRENRQIK